MVEGLRACFADGVRLLFDIDVLDYRPSLNKATATGVQCWIGMKISRIWEDLGSGYDLYDR
jgi:hypothetical protein